jgi:hypothetical protein
LPQPGFLARGGMLLVWHLVGAAPARIAGAVSHR